MMRQIIVVWLQSLVLLVIGPTLLLADESTFEGNAGDRPAVAIDLSGRWKIQEDDKEYEAILDAKGNGSYSWQNGRVETTSVVNGLWEGRWFQAGNDREGGFEVLLSEDHTRAEGSWWYTRVENHRHIPPGITGGSYIWIRLTPVPQPLTP